MASAPEGTNIPYRAPPGMVLSQDLFDAKISSTPQPDFENPRVYAAAFYKLAQGQGPYTGVYGVFGPGTLQLETDWFTTTQEYWVQTSVVWANHYAAEIGLDIMYINVWEGVYLWYTRAYAGYNDGQGSVVLGFYDLGWSYDEPYSAVLATYWTGGSTWAYNVNGYVFATHPFPEYWGGYEIHSVTEAYNQPIEGTYNQYLSYTGSINIKRGDNGQWSQALYDSENSGNGVYNDWMVNIFATDGYNYVTSARY
jgi:hypothetical protein